MGLQIETGKRLSISTVNSTFVAYGHPVTLVAAGIELDSLVFFAEDERLNRNVLGRRGWHDRVVVGINDYDGKLYISLYH